MRSLKSKLYVIIFRTDTKAGKNFDVFLLWLILFSVLTVMLESVPEIGNKYSTLLLGIEYTLTFLFTIEYLMRISVSPKPMTYVLSFWGIIDLLSIIPTYLGFFLVGYHYFMVVRIFRLLRVFRILKLARFNSESRVLMNALKASSYKVGIFLIAVLAIATIMGTIMYVVEGGEKGFSSIPQSIYWAIVTITTVGYGDMVPQTVVGKIVSSFSMILGYAIIAVPTGIVTVELSNLKREKLECPECDTLVESNSNFCSNCGLNLNENN